MHMNTFSAGTSLRAGWEIFKKRPGYFAGAAAIILVATWIASAVSTSIGGDSFVGMILNILLSAFVGMGAIAFGLKAFEDAEKADIHDLWHPKPYLEYVLSSIIVQIAVVVGLILLIVPGVILALMFSMTSFLIVSRDMKAIDAIKESMRITEGNRLELFLLMIALLGINILGAICLVVGLLVSVPVSLFALISAFRALEQKASAVVAPTA